MGFNEIVGGWSFIFAELIAFIWALSPKLFRKPLDEKMVHRLYLDFFRFLNQMEEKNPWPAYQRLYLRPHEKFLLAYWKNFNYFDLAQIAGRVRQVKREDYGHLRSLIQSQDPALLAEKALGRCQRAFPYQAQPPVYLFVGFFSADGVAVEVDGSPSIALGLERFQDFRDLPLLVAHEYCHCAQRSLLKKFFSQREHNLLFTIIAEGLSVLFSQLVYPEIPVHRHLFLTEERLQWCRENQETLLELAGADLASAKLVPILFGPGDPKAGLPPRLGYFISRQMLGHCLSHHGPEDFGHTFPGFEDLFRKIMECYPLPAGPKKE